MLSVFVVAIGTRPSTTGAKIAAPVPEAAPTAQNPALAPPRPVVPSLEDPVEPPTHGIPSPAPLPPHKPGPAGADDDRMYLEVVASELALALNRDLPEDEVSIRCTLGGERCRVRARLAHDMEDATLLALADRALDDTLGEADHAEITAARVVQDDDTLLMDLEVSLPP